MGFVIINCPNCGAEIELDSQREYGYCTYCGTKVVQEKIIVEHRGTVNIDGVADLNALLERAYIFIEDGKFQQANQYFDRVLDINPRCSKAYFGKLLCQLHVKNADEIKSTLVRPLPYYDNYNKAKKFANENEMLEYEEIEKFINQKYENKRNSFKEKINNINAEINSLNQYLEVNNKSYKKLLAKKILDVVLVSVMLIILLFFIVGVFALKDEKVAVIIFLILCLWDFIGVILLFVLITKKNKLIKEYNGKKETIIVLQKQIDLINMNCEAWKRNIDRKIDENV